MESYKIRVNNEAESKEAQELFFELGYSWPSTGKNVQSQFFFLIAYSDGDLNWNTRSQFGTDDSKELTLPQLRDLVVLKRNDVNDANYRSKSVLDGFYFKSCDGIFYFMFEGKWVRSTTNTDEGLEPITKGSDLISGADALRALADGKEVEYNWLNQKSSQWMLISDELKQFSLYEILNGKTVFGAIKFRLKPQTIRLELELPKPFEPKVGDLYWCVAMTNLRGYTQKVYKDDGDDECLIHLGAYRTEEEIKQVVEQLRKIKGAV